MELFLTIYHLASISRKPIHQMPRTFQVLKLKSIDYSYNMIRVTENSLEPNAIEKGLFSYVLNGVESINLKLLYHKRKQFVITAFIFAYRNVIYCCKMFCQLFNGLNL